MTQYYSCGHIAELDKFDNYTNGSYALWLESDCYGEADEQLTECYGCLCNSCMEVYHATPCMLGGNLFDEK